jgi:DNA gyrase subunit A
VLVASRLGQLKRLALESLRSCQRGDIGQIGLRFLDRSDELLDLQTVQGKVIGITLADGRNLRQEFDALENEDVSGTGTKLALANQDQLKALVPLICS